MAPSRSTDPPAPPAPEPGRLDSWKEIAAYLNRSITTVQRWEQQEGLPVHRLLHSKSGSVYSLTHELDAWRSQRDSLPEEGPAIFPAVPVMTFRRWHVAVLSSVVLSIVALGGLAAALGWPSAPPRITSVRTVVADLERFGGRLRSTEYCESPYANWSWTSDGERIYLALPRVPGQGPASSYALYQVPIAGGEPIEVPLPFEYEVRLLDFVPEESALLVRGTSEAAPLGTGLAGMPLWLVSTIDGTTRRIPNVVGNWADVAPDGRTLALIRLREKDRPRLVLARLDGSRDTDLGPVPTDIFRPRWAPDGTRLRFFRGGFGRTESQVSIWERGIHDGAPRSLWPGSRGDWTPDGRYFVYDREDPGSFRQDLYAQREARWNGFRSSEPAPLTMGPLSYWSPGASRNGRELFAFGRLGSGELMRFDPATKTFAPALDGESIMYVEPSPDGEWLVWSRYPEGTLWKSRPDGSERQQLTSKPLQAHLPRWSPDGRTIVFAGWTPDDPRLAIYRVTADGSTSEIVYRSTGPNDHFWDPCWRPDGTLVFSRVFNTTPPGILQRDPKTGQVTPMRGAETLRWPKCSRQGDILAAADHPAGFRYVVLRHGGDRWEDLGPAKIAYPQWTRDGTAVCGLDLFTGRIDCLSIATGRVVTLAQPPFPLLAWVGAAWMGLDSNDRPLVVADRSKTALYAFEWEQP
jgi:hypothetical protein